jgi:hypothetical protein
MNTDTLMSSLREMVKAEAQLQVMELGVGPWHHTQVEEVRLQYSRHETVVREQLEMLGKEAGAHAV